MLKSGQVMFKEMEPEWYPGSKSKVGVVAYSRDEFEFVPLGVGLVKSDHVLFPSIVLPLEWSN